MPITAKVYGKFMQYLVSGNSFNWQTDTIKMALLSSSYTPDQDNHDFFDDVQAHEISGTGYTVGGQALTNKSISYDPASNTLSLLCADVAWPESTITARYAVLYKDTGTPSTSPLIAYADFGASVSSTNGTFKVVVDPTGIIKLQTP